MCQESRQLDHAGLGLGGEGTALHVAKMMVRQGGDPHTRFSANDDDKDVRDGKGANTKGRRGNVLSAPDG